MSRREYLPNSETWYEWGQPGAGIQAVGSEVVARTIFDGPSLMILEIEVVNVENGMYVKLRVNGEEYVRAFPGIKIK